MTTLDLQPLSVTRNGTLYTMLVRPVSPNPKPRASKIRPLLQHQATRKNTRLSSPYSMTCTVLYVSDVSFMYEIIASKTFVQDAIRLTLGYLRDPQWNSTYNPYTIPWPEAFVDGHYSVDHAHHCMNGIRQSLQCHADVTPQVFQYVPERDMVRSNFNVLHTCRNFDAVCGYPSSFHIASYYPRNTNRYIDTSMGEGAPTQGRVQPQWMEGRAGDLWTR